MLLVLGIYTNFTADDLVASQHWIFLKLEPVLPDKGSNPPFHTNIGSTPKSKRPVVTSNVGCFNSGGDGIIVTLYNFLSLVLAVPPPPLDGIAAIYHL